MNDVWVCRKCCSKDIEEQVWVKSNSYNGNTAEVVGEWGDIFWCPDCEADEGVCTYDEFGVEDDTEQAENSRLDQIMSGMNEAMTNHIERLKKRSSE